MNHQITNDISCFISADEVKYEEIISMDPDDNIGNFIEEVD